MRTLLITLVGLVLSSSVFAQDASTSSNAQVNSWMAQAQEVQKCMAKIDQQQLEKMQQEAEVVAEDVKQLCQANKRSEAQTTAVNYGKKLAKDPNVLVLKECAGLVKMDIPQTVWADLESGDTENHVCDVDLE